MDSEGIPTVTTISTSPHPTLLTYSQNKAGGPDLEMAAYKYLKCYNAQQGTRILEQRKGLELESKAKWLWKKKTQVWMWALLAIRIISSGAAE